MCVVGDGVGVEELAFRGLAGGVADEAGGAADEGVDLVAGPLVVAEGHDGDEVAGLEAVGGGVEAAVE